MKTALGVCAIVALWVSPALAVDKLDVELTIKAGKQNRRNVPVVVPLDVPVELQGVPYFYLSISGKRLAATPETFAQITPPALSADEAAPPPTRRELHFILHALNAGDELKLTGTIDKNVVEKRSPLAYKWTNTPGQHDLLTFNNRPVLDYIDEPLDESSKERRFDTFKPYHQVYDPEGTTLITKGLGGLYPHHRGLFFGFNKVTYGDGLKADVWHCTGDAFQSPETILSEQAGPILARQLLAIDWHGEKKAVFAHEQRELTVYNVPGGTLIDFASRVDSAGGTVHLDGDPQHSGFHFRASETVHKNEKQTYYLRKSGVDKPGVEINWDPKLGEKNDPRTIDQPWKGVSFEIDGQRFTVAMLDRPSNPKPARFSERTYGRFGSYFVYDVKPGQPLYVRYRVWAQRGEMTPETIAALDEDFVNPGEVSVAVK